MNHLLANSRKYLILAAGLAVAGAGALGYLPTGLVQPLLSFLGLAP
jgi:hypothetical protein